MSFLKQKGYASAEAVSALKKLATLGHDHSFLSGHPDPELRAERISLQTQGKALSLEETQRTFIDKIKIKLGEWYSLVLDAFSGVNGPQGQEV